MAVNTSPNSPAQIILQKQFGPLVALAKNPMFGMLLGKVKENGTDDLTNFLKYLASEPEKLHEELHKLHEQIGELLNADHRAGYQSDVSVCAPAPGSGAHAASGYDAQRKDDPGGSTTHQVADEVSKGSLPDSGLETALQS